MKPNSIVIRLAFIIILLALLAAGSGVMKIVGIVKIPS